MLTRTQVDSGLFLVTNSLATMEKKVNDLHMIVKNVARETDPYSDTGRRAIRLNGIIGDMLRLTRTRGQLNG
jgi:archaellum component FlaC